MKASDLLNRNHPLHAALLKTCQRKGVPVTKRQARKLLQKYPGYRSK